MSNSTYSPYDVIISLYVTEKATVLKNLSLSESNKCTRRCVTPKYTFLVALDANKREVAKALAAIYPGITVLKVNIITGKPKKKMRRKRGVRAGKTSRYKKAIVTFKEGDSIEELEV